MAQLFDVIVTSILTSSYTEQTWKQIYQTLHTDSLLKTQKNDDIVQFCIKLAQRLKKDNLNTNQLKTALTYIAKIMTLDGALLGPEWNQILLDNLDSSDSQISALISEIINILIMNDEIFRKSLFQYHLTTPKTLGRNVIEKMSLKGPKTCFRTICDFMENPKFSSSATELCLSIIEFSCSSNTFSTISETKVLSILMSNLSKSTKFEVILPSLWSTLILIQKFLKSEKIKDLSSFTKDLFSIFKRIHQLPDMPQEPLRYFANVIYIIFPHHFLEFIRANTDLDVTSMFSKFNFTPRLLSPMTNELKVESLQSIDIEALIPEMSTIKKKKKIDTSTFMNEFKNIEKIYGENSTSVESWGQKISDLQGYIEIYFDKQKTTISNDTTKLQKDLLILRNQLLYEKYQRKQLEHVNKKMHKKVGKSWEIESNYITLNNKHKTLESEVGVFKEQIAALKKEKQYAKSLHQHWDHMMNSKFDKVSKTLDEYKQSKLMLEEQVDKWTQKIEKLNLEVDNANSEIYLLKTRLGVFEEDAKKHDKLKDKLNSIQQELLLFEQKRIQLIEVLMTNKKLNSGLFYRDQIINSLNSQLESLNEKIRQMYAVLHEKDIIMENMKRQMSLQHGEIQQYKSVLEYQSNMNHEKIVAVERKYKSVRDINTKMREKLSDLNKK